MLLISSCGTSVPPQDELLPPTNPGQLIERDRTGPRGFASPSGQARLPAEVFRCPVERSVFNPIIFDGVPGLSGGAAESINGPAPIEVPGWIRRPLGRYYLYFAHHTGKSIRLAYADSLWGPWVVYNPGVLHVDDTPAGNHVASPDIYLDHEAQQVRMYFHGPRPKGVEGSQATFVALSDNGLDFVAQPQALAPPYLRVFTHDGAFYGIASHKRRDGVLLRSADGMTAFTEGPNILPNVRHVGLGIQNGHVSVFYSRKGHAPERILRADLIQDGDWQNWYVDDEQEVLRPTTVYEGVEEPITTSTTGFARDPLHELRDPTTLISEGRAYLFYSVAGEQGIAYGEFACAIPPG